MYTVTIIEKRNGARCQERANQQPKSGGHDGRDQPVT
jgi:hypothetical protein